MEQRRRLWAIEVSEIKLEIINQRNTLMALNSDNISRKNISTFYWEKDGGGDSEHEHSARIKIATDKKTVIYTVEQPTDGTKSNVF